MSGIKIGGKDAGKIYVGDKLVAAVNAIFDLKDYSVSDQITIIFFNGSDESKSITISNYSEITFESTIQPGSIFFAKRSQERHRIIANTPVSGYYYSMLADDSGNFVSYTAHNPIRANAGDTIGESTNELGSEGALWVYLIDR